MRITLIVTLLIVYSSLYSQLSPSKSYALHGDLKSSNLSIECSQDEIQELINLQLESERKNVIYPVGKLIPLQLDLMQKAEWTYDEFDNRIGKLTIHSTGATGLGVYFSDFFLPIGAKFSAYSPSQSESIGPFSFVDNPKEKGFGSGTINGEFLVLEVFIPKGTKALPQLKIGHLGYQRNPRLMKNKASRDFGDSKDCQVNVLCDEGDDWQDKKNAVVRIKMVFGGFEGWCTGTIMNNTYQDCTPYVLTADHCRHSSDGSVAAESEYANWEFYFQYESTKCKSPSSEGSVKNVKLTGCTRKASGDNGGEGDPDFLLLRLNNVIPQTYNPHFAGWDKRGLISTSGVMIHHPAGDIKKISTFVNAVESSEWDATKGKDTHWKLTWSKTKNGFGVSEGGSSGSALWNQDKRVVGQLTGGSSACEEGNGTGPFNPDYFGKFSAAYHWNLGDSTRNLLYWLDNGRNNAFTMDGINWPCNELPLTKSETQKDNHLIRIFPNPAQNQVTLTKKEEGPLHVIIYDGLGQQVLEKTLVDNDFQIDVSSWTKGIYMINYQSNNLFGTLKLNVQ